MLRAALFLLLPSLALANANETFYENNANQLQSSAPGAQTAYWSCTGPGSCSTTFTVPTASTTQWNVSGSVTMNATAAYGNDTCVGNKGLTFTFGTNRTGALCSASALYGACASYNRGGSCTVASTNLQPGDVFWVQLSASMPTAADNISVNLGANTNVVVPLGVAVGGSCICNGICNGAGCGTLYGSGGSWPTYTGQCDCTACSGTALAAPTLACVTYSSGAASCSWGSVPSPTSYTLQRSGSTVYNGASQSYIDQPGNGTYTYGAFGTGNCTPALGGTSLYGKNTSTSTQVMTVTAGGFVGLLGMAEGCR